MTRIRIKDLPVGSKFNFIDRHREHDGSGYDHMLDGEIIGTTTANFVAIRYQNVHRIRYDRGGELITTLEWPGIRHGLWDHNTMVDPI